MKIFPENDVVDTNAPIEVQLAQIIGHPLWDYRDVERHKRRVEEECREPLWMRLINSLISLTPISDSRQELDWRLSELNDELEYFHSNGMRKPPDIIVAKLKRIKHYFPRSRLYCWYYGLDPIIVLQIDIGETVYEFYPLVYDEAGPGRTTIIVPR